MTYASEGGVIISGENDCNVIFILDRNKISYEFVVHLFRDIFEKLTNKRFTIDSNDILDENGCKVAGSTDYHKTGENHSTCFSISISLEDHSEDVKKLCVKYKDSPFGYKEPSFVEGVTKEQILKKFYTYLGKTIRRRTL